MYSITQISSISHSSGILCQSTHTNPQSLHSYKNNPSLQYSKTVTGTMHRKLTCMHRNSTGGYQPTVSVYPSKKEQTIFSGSVCRAQCAHWHTCVIHNLGLYWRPWWFGRQGKWLHYCTQPLEECYTGHQRENKCSRNTHQSWYLYFCSSLPHFCLSLSHSPLYLSYPLPLYIHLSVPTPSPSFPCSLLFFSFLCVQYILLYN